MNRLRQLRENAGLTLRQLEKYVEIRNATLSQIENGKQPFREIHVLKLTSFFDVTSDYLLGYSNAGIGIYFDSSQDDNDHAFISESELHNLLSKFKVNTTLLTHNICSEMHIRTNKEDTTIYNGKCSIFRSANVSKEKANINESVREQIISEINHLDMRNLEKVLKFINEYIK